MDNILYRVEYKLEKYFSSINDAMENFTLAYEPHIPSNLMVGENIVIPRICVAPSISDCLTAIGSAIFRRVALCSDDSYDY